MLASTVGPHQETCIHRQTHEAGGRDLSRAVLAAGAIFLLWRAARGATALAWSVFGLAVAAYWTGFWPF